MVRVIVFREKCDHTDPDVFCRGRWRATDEGKFRYDYEKQAYVCDWIVRVTKPEARWKVGDFTGERLLLEACPFCHTALCPPTDAPKEPPAFLPRVKPDEQADGN